MVISICSHLQVDALTQLLTATMLAQLQGSALTPLGPKIANVESSNSFARLKIANCKYDRG